MVRREHVLTPEELQALMGPSGATQGSDDLLLREFVHLLLSGTARAGVDGWGHLHRMEVGEPIREDTGAWQTACAEAASCVAVRFTDGPVGVLAIVSDEPGDEEEGEYNARLYELLHDVSTRMARLLTGRAHVAITPYDGLEEDRVVRHASDRDEEADGEDPSWLRLPCRLEADGQTRTLDMYVSHSLGQWVRQSLAGQSPQIRAKVVGVEVGRETHAPTFEPAPVAATWEGESVTMGPQGEYEVRPARFAPLESAEEPAPSSALEDMLDVPLRVTVELGRTRVPIDHLLDLKPGTTVELDRLAGEMVDVLVNGRLIAKGEVVVVDDTFGVKITDILSPVDRMRGLS